MMNITTLKDGASVGDYFTGGSATFECTLEDSVRSTWFGKGARELGLSGSVQPEQFVRLCANCNPLRDEPLTSRMKAERRVAYDLTFSVPKSVSVAWAVLADPRIVGAVWQAAAVAMGEAEMLAATRVRTEGRSEDRRTGNLVGAAFFHLTARPVGGIPDPQLHVHAVVFNATRDEREQRWKALQMGPIASHAPLFQVVFHTELARQMAGLGYRILRTETGWELECVDRGTIERFSQRSRVIDEAAEKNGVRNPREKSRLGVKTREPKPKDLRPEDVTEAWRSRLSDSARERILNATANEKGPPGSARETPEVGDGGQERATERLDTGHDPNASRAEPEDRRQDAGRSSGEGRSRTESGTRGSGQEQSKESSKGSTKGSARTGPLNDAERRQIEAAVSGAFERSSALPGWALANVIMRAIPGRLSSREAYDFMAGLDLITSERRGVKFVTSRTVLARETHLLAQYEAGLDQCGPLLGEGVRAPSSLTNEAAIAFEALASSRDRIVVLDTVAGPSQKELIATFRAEKGFFTSYLEVLGDGSKQKGRSSWMGWTPPDQLESVLSRERILKESLPKVLWVSDAHTMSLTNASRLSAWAERNDVRVVLASENGLRRRPGRQTVIELLSRFTPEEKPRVNTLRHQPEDLRDIAIKFASGRGSEAIDRLTKERLMVAEPDALQRLATRAANMIELGKPMTVLAVTKSEQDQLNAAIRAELLKNGQLRGGRTCQRSDVFLSESEIRSKRTLYERGQIVEFQRNSGLGRDAGTKWKVRAVTPAGVVITNGTHINMVPLSKPDNFIVYSRAPVQVCRGERIRLTRDVTGETVGQRAANQILGGKPRSTRLRAFGEHVVTGFTVLGEMKLDNGVRLPRGFAHFEYAYAASLSGRAPRMADQVALYASKLVAEQLSAGKLYDLTVRARKLFAIWTDDIEAVRDAAARDVMPSTAHDIDKEREDGPEEKQSSSRTANAGRNHERTSSRADANRDRERNADPGRSDSREHESARTRYEENRAREQAAQQAVRPNRNHEQPSGPDRRRERDFDR